MSQDPKSDSTIKRIEKASNKSVDPDIRHTTYEYLRTCHEFCFPPQKPCP